MSALEVHQVPEGSVVVLTGVELDSIDQGAHLTEAIAAAVGHRRFAVLTIPGPGDVTVWGPDVDLSAEVRRLLEEAGMTEHPNALTGVPAGAEQVRSTPSPDDAPAKHRIPVTGTDEEGDSDGSA